ncbi:DUF2244 domain-containing protein [Rhizobium sp. LjRoot254]|uniref:DUF2244 domain-containing protein n=1 Tax=Rhizobium sp. LjRoot254 TaxID=3342297 RepID=UPI003ECCF7FE
MTIVDDQTPFNSESISNSEPVFNAVLTPYRSLGRNGFRIVIGLTLVFCLFNMAFFFITGALPVAMFFGLDFALLYGAFYLNYRAARAREEVSVSRTELSIRKVSPSGRARTSRYNPFWAKFQVDRHHEFGITGMAVTGEGRRTPVGNFLNPDDRESFARAFTSALASVKRRI